MRSFVVRFVIACIYCGMIVAWYVIPDNFFVDYTNAHGENVEKTNKIVIKNEEEKSEKKVTQEKVKKQKESQTIKGSIRQSVPFTVQAPHAQWDDPRYQDACEEASVLMAYEWINGNKHLSKNDAEESIEKMFVKEHELFGEVVDTSVADTARFFEEYYGKAVQVYESITMEGMYRTLSNGDIIIAPTNGKMLNNPNFTNGGPERHMLVVIGYDRENREFITNDPGTRVGRGYKYKDTTLYNAIRDYATGNKEEIIGASKNVIIIKK